MNESKAFVESGLIYQLGPDTLPDFKFKAEDFDTHKEPYQFVIKYLDEMGKFPEKELLRERYPTMETTASNVDWKYLTNQFDDHVLRKNLRLSFKGLNDIVDSNPKKALEILTKGTNELIQSQSDDLFSYASTAEARLAAYNERVRQRGMGMLGIPTPFTQLNETGVGFLPGNLVAAFARPEAGKTWLSDEVAVVAAMAGKKVLLISPEMTAADMQMRLDVILAHKMKIKLSHYAIRSGSPLDMKTYKKFLKASEKMENLFISDSINGQGITFEGITQLVRKHRPDLLVIDGIYLVTTGTKEGALWEVSHNMFSSLKIFCVAQNIAAFVTTQANRDSGDTFKIPRQQDVAFGDAMIRAADIAFGMARVEGDDKLRQIGIQKYRDGMHTGKVMKVIWDVDKGHIEDDGEIDEGNY
ncbi:MAG: DnaB-like helicase C-terminal domain-containing protein [Candidatus Thorarchaeota archaeon]|jgi:replicative DNA helicase